MNDLRQKNPDLEFTHRALELAAEGKGLVSPNPLVGCVIVSADGEVVGRGTYIKDKIIHAEVAALTEAGERARGGTAYVSLEPHNHYGRTPPCTEALINAGIKRVVSPIEDPNPLVSGRGFATLREAGIEVVTGILAEEATRLNERFICWHKKQRPFVHLKLALSLDGRISLGPSVSAALSGSAALERVHSIRHENDAILVGSNTAVVDNPKLTDRSEKPRSRPLVRVVLDSSLRTPADSNLALADVNAPTIIYTSVDDTPKAEALRTAGAEVISVPGGPRNLRAVLQDLYNREIQSVLVEGGSEVAAAFIESGLVDKITLIYSPLIIGGSAPCAIGGKGASSLEEAFRLKDCVITRLGPDFEITGYPEGGK